jgi:predicted nucleic acid-binding protein
VRKYVIDTNLYIEATREDEAADALKGFYAQFLPYVFLHSVVAQELLAGAMGAALKRRTERQFIEPFESVSRVITPTHSTWKRAGEILAELVRLRKISAGGVKPSFLGDCLLAASGREHGFDVVTRNIADFKLISIVESVNIRAPWPSRP